MRKILLFCGVIILIVFAQYNTFASLPGGNYGMNNNPPVKKSTTDPYSTPSILKNVDTESKQKNIPDKNVDINKAKPEEIENTNSSATYEPVIKGTFNSQIINRSNEGWFGNTYFPVYVISNIPETEVMPPICHDTLKNTGDENTDPHCKYIALNSLGTFGKKKSLLPYNPAKRAQTILVIDRSKLTENEKSNLNILKSQLFASAPVTPTNYETTNILDNNANNAGFKSVPRDFVNIWVQNKGDYGKENQVIVDLPDVRWLIEASNDLWHLPANRFKDNSKDTYSDIIPVNKIALLTNQFEMESNFAKAFRYLDIQMCEMAFYNIFINKEDLTQKIIAINWNGGTEITPEKAAKILPPALTVYCTQLTADNTGTTGWQQFCKKAIARRDNINGTETWTFCAPTKETLNLLINKVMEAKFKDGLIQYSVDITDLTYLKNISLETVINTPDIDKNRITNEPLIKDSIEKTLNIKVNSTTNADGKILLTLNTVEPVIAYTVLPVNRLTPYMGAFNEPAPDSPSWWSSDSRPSPDDEGSFWENLFSNCCNEMTSNFIDNACSSSNLGSMFGCLSANDSDSNSNKNSNKNSSSSSNYEPPKNYKYPGSTYQQRESSPEYRAAVIAYDDAKRSEQYAYEANLDQWRDRKKNWINAKRSLMVTYEYPVHASTSISIAGMISFSDLKYSKNIILNKDISLNNQPGIQLEKGMKIEVQGNETSPKKPAELKKYKDKLVSKGWNKCVETAGADSTYLVVLDSLVNKLREELMKFKITSLLYSDLKPWNVPFNMQ